MEGRTYSTAELYSELLEDFQDAFIEIALDGTIFGTLYSVWSSVASTVDQTKSYVSLATARVYQIGDICVQIDLNNGTSYDRFIGYYNISGSGSNKRIHIIDEVMYTDDTNSSPFENQYRYEHYSTLPGATSREVETGTLF